MRRQLNRIATAAVAACALSVAVSWLAAWLLAVRQAPLAAVALAALSLSLVLLGWATPRITGRGSAPGWLIAAAVLNLLLVAPELGLRAAGFRHESGIQFGYPRPSEFRAFRPDEQLFWTYDPTVAGINSWGFPAPEVESSKAPGSIRLVFLGDSCTEQGYPGMVEVLLGARHPERRFEAVSLAISGYSSYQGLKVAERYASRVAPDLVTVYFGWNDHWLAYREIDSAKRIDPSSGLARRAIASSRWAQGLMFLGERLLGRSEGPLAVPRVPEPEYRSNLTAIVRTFASSGVSVLLVTAPTSHPVLGVPEQLVQRGFTSDSSACIAAHRRYNEIVREVAKAEPTAVLIDLEARFGGFPAVRLGRIFTADGIHFTPEGLALVASLITDQLEGTLSGPSGGSIGGPSWGVPEAREVEP